MRAPRVKHKLSESYRRAYPLAIAGLFLSIASACSFSERSFPMRPNDFVRVSMGDSHVTSVREWLPVAHAQLEHLLPKGDRPALLTNELADETGQAIDVASWFHLQHRNLRMLWHNWTGIAHSAQAIGGEPSVEHRPASWAGFHEVTIPVAPGVELSGRLGFAQDAGGIVTSDCIVLLPGLFGDNGILRTRDLAAALRNSGFHVLALELRGHGATEARQPDVYYTFGVLETVDLLRVSEWLEDDPRIDRTGLIGFCWGANLGLLAAWYDATNGEHPDISEKIREHVQSIAARPHFTAGIMAFSAILSFEDLLDELSRPHSLLGDPILHSMQNTVRARMGRKQHQGNSHCLLSLVEAEFANSPLCHPGSVDEGRQFLRLVPYGDKPGLDRVPYARVPILVIHGANDPLKPPQDVADLMAGVTNPNVAALVLPGGGHVGFPPYARSYYFSLVLNFFDPVEGAAAATRRAKSQSADSSAYSHSRALQTH